MNRLVQLAVSSALFVGGVFAESQAKDVADVVASAAIAAQPLGQALSQLRLQTGLNVVYVNELAEGKRSQGSPAGLSAEEMLKKVLEGTGLSYKWLDGRTVVVRSEEEKRGEARAIRTSAVEERAAAELPVPETDGNQSRASTTASRKDEVALNEVVVTGSHIRGESPVGSPVLVYTRADIERTGAATAQQFIGTLTQNFGGGITQDTNSAGQIPNQFSNDVYGSSANLRGLGSGSTLVLVNGRRMASAGAAEYVDISMIPLSAVDRIEILTDGASAIYGSDAVAGVVNIIMKKGYRGAETRVHAGTTTQGGGDELQFAQSLGFGWNSGTSLLSYEHFQSNPINALDREYSKNNDIGGSYALVADQKRNSAYVSVQQNISTAVNLSADAAFSERRAGSTAFDPSLSEFNRYSSRNRQYGGSLAVGFDLGGSWDAELAGGLSRTTLLADNLSSDLSTSIGTSDYRVNYAQLKLGGSLFSLPAGPVRLAAGAEFRHESYQANTKVFPSLFSFGVDKTGFDARAGFSEIMVPLLRGSEVNGSIPKLALSLAGRYENYSNVGTTFNPKFGIRWVPMDALQVRASYGTSFKAPSVVQVDESQTAYLLLSWPDDQSVGGERRFAALLGNNADLKPEKSKTWTMGFDLQPPSIPGMSVKVTGFDIRYKDRILSVPFNPILVLYDPAYAALRVRREDLSDVQFDQLFVSLLSARDLPVTNCDPPVAYGDACSEPVSNFSAILDFGLRNLAETRNRGIDVNVRERAETRFGAVDLELVVTRLVRFEQQITPTAPTLELMNTIYNPPRLKARVAASWSRNQWGTTVTANYTGSYQNNAVTNVEPISSWTTFDVALRYEIPHWGPGSMLDNVRCALNVNNVFDRDPPFAEQFGGLGYDPANADPYGRMISLVLTKSW